MAEYTEKRASALKRIAQLEADQKTIKPAKADRVKAKLAAARERLTAIDAKAATNGQPPKAKAAKRGTRAKK